MDFVECMKEHINEPNAAARNARVRALIIFKKYCGPLWMNRMKFSWSPDTIKVPQCVNQAIPRLMAQASAEVQDKLSCAHEEVETVLDSDEETEFEF